MVVQRSSANRVRGCYYLVLDSASGGSATVNMTAGDLSADYASINRGIFNQYGGTNSIHTNLYIGFSSETSGTYTLSGISLLSAKNEYIGYTGNGSFTQTGGMHLVTGCLYLGKESRSSGSYTLAGNGMLIISGEGIEIGANGNGRFNWYGGTLITPKLNVCPFGTLAMGFDFDMASLFDGSMFYGSTFSFSAADLEITNGATAWQTGNTNIAFSSSYCYLFLGSDQGSGNYNLSGSTKLNVSKEYVGYSGNGVFTQSGGTNIVDSLSLGYKSGSTGKYYLSDSGVISSNEENIGSLGVGVFNQAGGSNTTYGLDVNSLGTYILTGGCLSARVEYLHGKFTHTGGMNSVRNLQLGDSSSVSATYNLSGKGCLSAEGEGIYRGTFFQSGGSNVASRIAVGNNGRYCLSDTGVLYAQNEFVDAAVFEQSGGINSVGNLEIMSNGMYLLSGGTLQIRNGIFNQGIIDCNGGTATINAVTASIFDLTQVNICNAHSASLKIDAGSLLLVSTGYDPATTFGFYTNAGMTHVVGSTLTVASDQGFGGSGIINDLVVCVGNIDASSGGSINLNKGLVLFGNGNVCLGAGELTVDDNISCMTGGTLRVYNQYIGKDGTGKFTQSAGQNSISETFYLGYHEDVTGGVSFIGIGIHILELWPYW